MKNYVLCTTLEPDSIETLKKIKHDIALKHAMIHLVKIVEIQVFTTVSMISVYPTEADYPEIERDCLDKLNKLAQSLGIDADKVVLKCFFDLNREEKIISYLKAVNADLVVTSTRGKHGIEGFFSSSFTDFLCKFSPCDILVMRPVKK